MELNTEQLREILTILSELDPDRVMERIVNIVPRVFHSKICALFLQDEDNQNEIVLAKASVSIQFPPSLRITYEKGEGLTGWVFKHKKPLLLADLDKKSELDLRATAPDLSWKGKYSSVGLQKPKSYLGAPLINSKGQCMGVIRMSADDINFTTEDLDLMQSFAQYISLGLEKANLFIHEKRKLEYFTLLTDIGTKLHTYYNQNDLLNFIARGCAQTFSSETCEIYIRSEENPDLLVLRAGYGIPEKLIHSATHQVGEGLTGHIVKEGKVLRSRNVLSLSQYKGKYRHAIKDTLKYGDRLTFLGMPIRIKSDIIGAIKLYNKIPRDGIPFFTEDAEKFLAILVDMLAVALENLKYLDSMQISAIKMMQIQRLTALGTLAIRVPNEISNPLTVARLNVFNLLRSLESTAGNPASLDPADIREKARNIGQFLEEVSAGIRTLQEFSTKAGFMKSRRAWSEIIDESLLFLSNDLLTKKVKISRSKDEERELPELRIEPNEGIEILITLVKIILDSISHYDSKIVFRTELIQAPPAIATTIEGLDNKSGPAVQASLAGYRPVAGGNLFNPTNFSLKVVEEIIRNNYDGHIEYLAWDENHVSRIRLVLPLEKIQFRTDANGKLDSDH